MNHYPEQVHIENIMMFLNNGFLKILKYYFKGNYLKKHEEKLFRWIKFTLDIFKDYIMTYLSLDKTSGIMRTRKQ